MEKPSQKSLDKMQKFVDKFRTKSGTYGHPEPQMTELLVEGLARNVEEVGRPLCPCQFFPEGKEEAAKDSYWACPCVEMQAAKYCH